MSAPAVAIGFARRRMGLLSFVALGTLVLIPACAPEGADLADATWVLELPAEWGDTPEGLTPTEVTLEFEPGDSSITGTFAFQRYTGTYAVDDNAISFDKLGWTTFCCMSAAGTLTREQEYLFALEDAQTYTVDGDSLTISYGGRALIFHRK